MTSPSAGRRTGRTPLSPLHAELGDLLRRTRSGRGLTTRDLAYSSGHISNVEGGHVTPSSDLLEAYIALGADRAALMPILDAIRHESERARQQHRRSRKPARRPAPVTVDDATLSDDIRSHYVVERYDLEFRFTARGSIASVHSTVAITAVSPGVTLYYTGHSADGSGRPGRLGLEVSHGARVEHVSESPNGATDVYLRLDRPIDPGDGPYELAYRVNVADDRPADPQIVYLTRPGVRAHRLTVQFTPPALPVDLWRFGVPDPYAADRPERGTRLPASPDHRYEHDFDRIVPGWCYGVSWAWTDGVQE